MWKSPVLLLCSACLLLVSACATTTPREKVQTGVTQVAFGAPLVLTGSMGLASMVVLAAVDAADRGILIDEPVYIGPVLLAGAILVTGSTLVAVGSASLSEGLEGTATKDDARLPASLVPATDALEKGVQGPLNVRPPTPEVDNAAEETQRQLKAEEPKQWHPDD